MNEIIKQKIEQINRGEVPLGYKKTKVGIVPQEWAETHLSKLFNFKNGLNKEKEAFGTGTPIVNYVDVWKKRGLKSEDLEGRVTLTEKEIENYNVKKGDVFFTRTSETKDEIGMSSVMLNDTKNTVFSGFILRARPFNEKLFTPFNQYCYSSALMRHEVIRKSSITTRALTSGPSLGQVQINLPSIREQQRIAEILSKWDEAIELQEKLIDKLEEQKKALMQKLLTPKDGWKVHKLSGVTKEISIRNKNNYCSNIKSVSNKNGFVNQNEQFSKQVASKDTSNYKIVRKGNIAYNPSRINVGSIALYDELDEGIISPMYVVFECINISPKMLLLLLSTARGKYSIESYLSGSVRESLNYTDLKEIEIRLPSEFEQNKIIKMFEIIDRNIFAQNNLIIKQKEQQKAMQQLLLTGSVRV